MKYKWQIIDSQDNVLAKFKIKRTALEHKKQLEPHYWLDLKVEYIGK